MKLSMFGSVGFLLVAAAGLHGDRDGARQERNEAPPTNQQPRPAATIVEMKAFAAEVEAIESELSATSGFQRDELLVMYGRSAAASGRFDQAAAAYAMFLNELGTAHPDSERIVMRFADCLFPFKFDEVNVVHTRSGPRLDAVWRMGYLPQTEHLRQALKAYELAALVSKDQHTIGGALLRLGWVHRVLGDWSASTEAWDRCAKEAFQTKSAADALWLAAENLEWSNRPADAAERVRRLAREYPHDDRIPAAIKRIEYLKAEASRPADWLSDPVASLKGELESYTSTRSASEVYRSVVQWLQRRGEHEAVVAVSRWACSQNEWTNKDQIACRYDLADALLESADRNALMEAADTFREIVELAPDEATAVNATLRCARVLNRLERHDDAERLMGTLANRVHGSKRWEPLVLTEFAEMFLARGDKERATGVLNSLAASHPDLDLTERFPAVRGANRTEGGP